MKKLIDSLRRIGLVANPEKASSVELVRRVARVLHEARRELVCDEATSKMVGGDWEVRGTISELARSTELLLVVGGDGTILKVAREVAGQTTPLMGVNAGNLGFLTAATAGGLESALRQLLAGSFSLEDRAMLEARLGGRADPTGHLALNDIVLGRGSTSRLIELEVRVNGELLTQYRCDGLIASSPTGSTAYSLAAGGAVVSPDAEVMILTPICPHTLSIRPIVLNLNAEVSVKLLSDRLVATLAVDGQQHCELRSGEVVTLRRSARRVRLVRLKGSTFFSTLRQKFGWSGGNV